jgi:hypothetical protein
LHHGDHHTLLPNLTYTYRFVKTFCYNTMDIFTNPSNGVHYFYTFL